MIEMYKGIANSPEAELTESISAQATIIKVSNADAFPDAPNLATIGSDESAETIRYAAKTADSLSGCERGIEGTARSWQTGEIIARNFTNKDHADLVDNLKELNESKATKQSVNELKSILETKADRSELSEKLGKTEKASDSQRLGGYDSSHFVTNKKLTDLVVDNLTTDDRTKAISAKQGKILKESVDSALQRAEQAFQSANNAKEMLVEAIIGMGGSASTSESFSELIRKLEDSAEEREAFNSRMVEIYFPSGVNEKGSAKMLYDKAVSISGRRYAYLFKPPRVLKNEFSKCDSVRVRVIFGEFTSNGYPFKLYLSDADGKALVDISTIDIGDYNEGTGTAGAYVRNWNTKTWSENLENIRVAIEFEFTEFYGVDPLGKGMPALALNLLDVSVEKLEVYFER